MSMWKTALVATAFLDRRMDVAAHPAQQPKGGTLLYNESLSEGVASMSPKRLPNNRRCAEGKPRVRVVGLHGPGLFEAGYERSDYLDVKFDLLLPQRRARSKTPRCRTSAYVVRCSSNSARRSVSPHHQRSTRCRLTPRQSAPRGQTHTKE